MDSPPLTRLIGVDASRAVVSHPTGTENYSRRLVEALLNSDSAYRWRLYLRNEPPPGFEGAELRVIRFPRLWTHLRLSWEMALRPPDALFVPAHVLPPIRPQVTLVTVHDVGYLRFPRAHPVVQRLYLDISTRWNVRVATHVLADSEATKADLVSHYGALPEKISVAYPGYDEGLGPVDDPTVVEQVRARYGLGTKYFIHLGTIQPRKNLSVLVSALSALSPDVSLVFAGKRGWLSDDLFSRVRSLGVEDRIVFPGYVPETDKAALLSGALGFVFPSLYEGFGLPVLEAQACGCPVVCSATSSLSEVAGEGAILLSPDDVAGWARAMNRLASDPELRADLIQRGSANLPRFSWAKCAQNVIHTLESLGV